MDWDSKSFKKKLVDAFFQRSADHNVYLEIEEVLPPQLRSTWIHSTFEVRTIEEKLCILVLKTGQIAPSKAHISFLIMTRRLYFCLADPRVNRIEIKSLYMDMLHLRGFKEATRILFGAFRFNFAVSDATDDWDKLVRSAVATKSAIVAVIESLVA